MLVFVNCQRGRIEGVSLLNSPGLNLGINDCTDVTVDGISILNPPDSPHTDGIDPKGAQRVLITRCRIDTGDDCIAAGGSRAMFEHDILIGHVAAAPITPRTPQWGHLIIRNLQASAGTVDAGLILGLLEWPAQDILLEHVSIAAPKGLQIAYTRGITLRDVKITPELGPALLMADTVADLKQVAP
jgi:glycosyl hydrolase family 28